MDLDTYIADLNRFISASPTLAREAVDSKFDQLALQLFQLQLERNEVCRRFATFRNASAPQGWREIPAIPTSSFKEQAVTILDASARQRWFQSSGTTEQKAGVHYHSEASLRMYETSLLQGYDLLLNRTPAFRRFICLTPSATEAPHSSLAYMFSTIGSRRFGGSADFAGVAGSDGWEIDFEWAFQFLREAEATGEAVLVAGTAFNFVHLLDACSEAGRDFALPTGSQALQTGGYKGRSRAVEQMELFDAISGALGVERVRTEYGMCELSSQAYDVGLSATGAPLLAFPPWARTRVVRPGTMHEVERGETGILQIVDLANVASSVAIETGDLAQRVDDDRFVLIGRAESAEPRGCSLQSRTILP